MSDFPTTLKRIRLSKGMTLEEFAALLGTSKQNISRYENGEVSPKISTAAAMADKLGISLAELNGGEKVTQLPKGLTDTERQYAIFGKLHEIFDVFHIKYCMFCTMPIKYVQPKRVPKRVPKKKEAPPNRMVLCVSPRPLRAVSLPPRSPCCSSPC